MSFAAGSSTSNMTYLIADRISPATNVSENCFRSDFFRRTVSPEVTRVISFSTTRLLASLLGGNSEDSIYFPCLDKERQKVKTQIGGLYFSLRYSDAAASCRRCFHAS